MTNQNFSTSTISDFPKVIAFLQPPYEHSNNCLQVKQDIAAFCQKKNLNLITAIDFEDPCDHQALNKLIDLVKYYASNHPVTLMINEEMVATPSNVIFWSVIGVLARMKLITVTAYDYEYGNIFLDDSYLAKLDFLDVASGYFDNHYFLNPKKAKKTYIDKLAQKSILFLQPPYTDESLELKAKLQAYCKSKDYGKLKAIKYKIPRDFTSLYELIYRVSISKAKPARIFIDQDIVSISRHKTLWIMLDTLLIGGAIEIYVYLQENGTLYLRRLKESEDRLLNSAIICEKLLNSNNKDASNPKEYVQETSRYFNWEEVKDSEVDSDIVE